jgi:hypothetical protein
MLRPLKTRWMKKMTEDESIEVARIANQIIAERLGEPVGTEYMRPSADLVPFTSRSDEGFSTQEVAEKLAEQILKILSPDWEPDF